MADVFSSDQFLVSVKGNASNCLREARVPLISKHECRRIYKDSYLRDIFNKDNKG